MTSHYFENSFVKLHYYKFGHGSENMLCFHGFGMHGKQFRIVEKQLGEKYTFWGFDLFFHKETKLKDQSLARMKKGLKRSELVEMILEFCKLEQIEKFSVLGYSMGTHYATAIVEELPERINEYIVVAPASVQPGNLARFFSKTMVGNKLLEKLIISQKVVVSLISLLKWSKIIDETGRKILHNEVGTPELRFALYSCFTYLRCLDTNEPQLIQALETYKIKSIFVFGMQDKMYLPRIGKKFFAKFTPTEIILLNEGHEMINAQFANRLAKSLL